MIILDEQLLGRNLEVEIANWYRGTVQFIIDLRPDTVIKDDGIPELLRQQKQPTFVTINETDFWQKVDIDSLFSVVCFHLPDTRAREIPSLLRSLLSHSEFDTKRKRMGMVIRVADVGISYYHYNDRNIKRVHS